MFGDHEMLAKILEAGHPKAMKAYGRAVRNFDPDRWDAACYDIVKAGNLAVHTERSVQPSDALASLRGLFEFVQWIDYCYARTIRSAPSTRILSPPERWRWTPGKSRNRKVCWTRKMPRSRRCASKSSRCPPDTPPKRSSIRRNAPSSGGPLGIQDPQNLHRRGPQTDGLEVHRPRC